MNFHIPHMTLRFQRNTFFHFPWKYIITFHMMMWHDTWTYIDHYDDTCMGYNLKMMTWTSWWGGNAKLYSLFLHLAFLTVGLIYVSSSWNIHFFSYLHNRKDLKWALESSESSCNVFFLSWSTICFMSPW